MRRITTLSSAVVAWLAPFASMATETADLSVTGHISAASCSVSLMGRDTVDLGPIHANEFVAGQDKVLEPTAAFVTIDCQSRPTKFRIRASDTSGTPASTPGSANYGLGMTGEKPIGYFKLGIAADIMQENNVVLKSTDGGKGQAWASHKRMPGHVPFDHDNEAYAFAASPFATEPASLTAIAIPLSIQAVLAKDPVVTDDVALAGQVTLEVLY